MRTKTSSDAMPENPIRRYARRIAKGVWWAATPWRTRQRLQFIRERAAAQARAAELSALVAKEEARTALRKRGQAVSPPVAIDLFDDADVSRAVGLPLQAVLCAPVGTQDVADRWSAVRFCIELWRRRSDLRARFPDGLASAGLKEWLRGEGRGQRDRSHRDHRGDGAPPFVIGH